MTERELIARIDGHMARQNELIDEIRAEIKLSREAHQLNLREHQLNRREHQLNRTAIQENRSVLRELVTQLREDRKILGSIEQGIQAQTAGLLHVLDELRGRGGGAEPAGA